MCIRDRVNLEHLFDRSEGFAVSELASSNSGQSAPRTLTQQIRPKSDLVALNSGRSRASIGQAAPANGLGRTQVAWNRGAQARSSQNRRNQVRTNLPANAADSEQEVIIIVRSKTDSRQAQTITVSDPSPQLLQYLNTMKQPESGKKLQLDMAQMRELN